jgi:hypothetical protein
VGCVPCKTSSSHKYKYSDSSLQTEITKKETTDLSPMSEGDGFVEDKRRMKNAKSRRI